MTQNELIQGMKNDLFNEVIFQIEVKGKTCDDYKELSKLIREKQHHFRILLQTLNIKKELVYNLNAILTDMSTQAYTEKNNSMLLTLDMYDKKNKS